MTKNPEKTSANHRHERHHRHASEKAVYLNPFLNDGRRDGSVTITSMTG